MNKGQRLGFFYFFLFAQLLCGRMLNVYAQQDDIKNVCKYLGERNDKNFLGSGNVALVVEQTKAKVLFVQQWKENGLFDWAAGTVRLWYPDRMEMNEAIPPLGANISYAPVSRSIFITRDDVVGMKLVWENTTNKNIDVRASFNGTLPGNIILKNKEGLLSSTVPYSEKVLQPVSFVVAGSMKASGISVNGANYNISFQINLKSNERKELIFLLSIATDLKRAIKAVKHWKQIPDISRAVRQDWNSWFENEIPRFRCSDPYFEKLYYYRWWSLYTKMILAKLGHFYFPAPREGTIMYDGVVSYSGSCVSVDELRWMRNPGWAFSTTREFFAPQNMNDGYLSNHIWDWGIDADSSNMDASGRSVPYQNYAVDAFNGTLLVHPQQGQQVLKDLWPQMLTNLQSYQRLFDIDKDGLYETYPWSNSAGQEWQARFSYFDPIPEMFRNERGRTYAPDGSNEAGDMKLLDKIKNSVVTVPGMRWPTNADELYLVYKSTADHRLSTVDQTTYVYKNFLAAAQLAQLLHDSSNEKLFKAVSEKTRQQLLSIMWNKEDHFFYDVKPIIQKQAIVKASTGFYPFWARIAGTEHLPMLQHIFNPKIFWTNYPLPSLPLDYEKYDQLQKAGWNYWNYATWPRTTCHVVDGTLWAAKTLDTSLRKQAVMLFDRYTRMHFPNDNIAKPNIAERYDPHSGAPFIENLDYNHSSWIDLLIQHIAGITPQDSDELIIDPVDMGWQYFSFKNIRYRNHDIDVEFDRKKGMLVKVDGEERAKESKLRRIAIVLKK